MIKLSVGSVQQSLQIRIAGNFLQRAIGLLFGDALPAGHFLYFPKCRAVHTFGMRYPLTIVFLDQEDRVLHVHQKVMPNRIVTCLRARAVCETRWRSETKSDLLDVTQLELALVQALAQNRKQK